MQKISKLRFLFRLLLLYTIFSAALKTPLVVQGTGRNNHIQILSHLDKDLRKVNISTETSRSNYGRALFFTPFSAYCKNLINQRTKGQTSWRVIIVPAVCLPYVWRYNSNSSIITSTTSMPSIRPTCACDMVFTKKDFVQVSGQGYEQADDFCMPNKCVADNSLYKTLRRRQGKNNNGHPGDECKCTSLNLVLKNPSTSPSDTYERFNHGCKCATTCFPKAATDTGKEETSDDVCVAKVTLTYYDNPSTGGIPVQTKFITKDIRCTCSEKKVKSRIRCECQPNV